MRCIIDVSNILCDGRNQEREKEREREMKGYKNRVGE